MLRDCPRCYRLLQEITFEGLRVDACPGCGGVWFDEGELARLAQAGMGAVRRLETRYRDAGIGTRRPELRCPNCRTPLARLTYPQAPGVELDACRACRGVWVDDRELGELAAAMERLAGGRSPTEERRTQP